MSELLNGKASPLLATLESAQSEGWAKKDLTVLAAQRDPFRLDTPANHRDGAWLKSVIDAAGVGGRTIHLRGLHYAALGLEAAKPNGLTYRNTEDDWLFLSEQCAKAARWLGYVGFEQIFDNRNATPTVRLHRHTVPEARLTAGLDITIPTAEEFAPEVVVRDFTGVQPYRLVLIGEKSSLLDVLGPVAELRQADLYLPTGEISDTLIYRVAKDTETDGRPLIVLYFADCDPAGWQMPISVSRKLQAFQAAMFEDISFEVHRVALTPDQVRAYSLPYAPMKDSERRKDRWRLAMGVEQTEIDAIATLQPDLLRTIALDAIAPFYDTSLGRRVSEAKAQWLASAQAALDASLDPDALAAIRADAERQLTEIREQLDQINDSFDFEVGDVDLPDIEIPRHDIDLNAHPLPLVSSAWNWTEQTRALIASKQYEAEESSDG